MVPISASSISASRWRHYEILKIYLVLFNFTYSMKISINNEKFKHFSITQMAQKEALPARNMELWFCWENRFA